MGEGGKLRDGRAARLTQIQAKARPTPTQAHRTHRSAWKRPNFLVRFLTIFALLRGVTFTMVPALCVCVWVLGLGDELS